MNPTRFRIVHNLSATVALLSTLTGAALLFTLPRSFGRLLEPLHGWVSLPLLLTLPLLVVTGWRLLRRVSHVGALPARVNPHFAKMLVLAALLLAASGAALLDADSLAPVPRIVVKQLHRGLSYVLLPAFCGHIIFSAYLKLRRRPAS